MPVLAGWWWWLVTAMEGKISLVGLFGWCRHCVGRSGRKLLNKDTELRRTVTEQRGMDIVR